MYLWEEINISQFEEEKEKELLVDTYKKEPAGWLEWLGLTSSEDYESSDDENVEEKESKGIPFVSMLQEYFDRHKNMIQLKRQLF